MAPHTSALSLPSASPAESSHKRRSSPSFVSLPPLLTSPPTQLHSLPYCISHLRRAALNAWLTSRLVMSRRRKSALRSALVPPLPHHQLLPLLRGTKLPPVEGVEFAGGSAGDEAEGATPPHRPTDPTPLCPSSPLISLGRLVSLTLTTAQVADTSAALELSLPSESGAPASPPLPTPASSSPAPTGSSPADLGQRIDKLEDMFMKFLQMQQPQLQPPQPQLQTQLPPQVVIPPALPQANDAVRRGRGRPPNQPPPQRGPQIQYGVQNVYFGHPRPYEADDDVECPRCKTQNYSAAPSCYNCHQPLQ